MLYSFHLYFQQHYRIFTLCKEHTYHKSSYFMQCAAACALAKTLHERPARLKGVESLNDPRHLSCSEHQQQNPLTYTKWKKGRVVIRQDRYNCLLPSLLPSWGCECEYVNTLFTLGFFGSSIWSNISEHLTVQQPRPLELHALLFCDKRMGYFTSPANHLTLKMQETWPCSPYPKRLESLPILLM